MEIGPVNNPESINTKKREKIGTKREAYGSSVGTPATPLLEIKVENSPVSFLTIAYTKDSLENTVI